ncbi:MAG: hypothetical protein ACI9UU_003522 [Candidatus Azotimanducaceae bacterium]|jgi:hypothetical protein
MLLRASSQQENREVDLNSVTREDLDSGVEHSEHLRALTEATIQNDWLRLAAVRRDAETAMGHQMTVDALVVASAFNGITRVADATGIPLDESTEDRTTDMRESTGIARFDYEEKSTRYARS